MQRAFLVLCAIFALSCGNLRKSDDLEEPSCSAPADAAFLTYNVAAGWDMVPMPGLRTPFVADAIADAQFDVACIQEAWHDEFRDAILHAVQLPPEQTFVADTVDVGETGEDVCTTKELEPLRVCAERACADLREPRETGLCVMKQCSREGLRLFFGRKHQCLRCLGAMAGHSIDEVYGTCTGDGASRVHGGRNGMMLLSRDSRLWNKEILHLPASNANKVALLATVHVPSAHGPPVEVEVACVHISSEHKLPPFHSGYSVWDDEKRAQVSAVMARLAERSQLRGDAPTVLMGDLNMGPDIYRKGMAVSPEVWKTVTDARYESPATDPYAGTDCTSCVSNTLNQGRNSHLIDHVAFRNVEKGDTSLFPLCTDRQFTEKVTVTGYDGKEKETNLSDHFGVRVMFRVKKR